MPFWGSGVFELNLYTHSPELPHYLYKAFPQLFYTPWGEARWSKTDPSSVIPYSVKTPTHDISASSLLLLLPQPTTSPSPPAPLIKRSPRARTATPGGGGAGGVIAEETLLT